MGFSFIGLGISLALLFIGGVIIYHCCFRRKRTTDQGFSENNRQDDVTGTGPVSLTKFVLLHRQILIASILKSFIVLLLISSLIYVLVLLLGTLCANP